MTETAPLLTKGAGYREAGDVALPDADFDALSELLHRIEARTAKVAIVGQGYVVLPAGMRAAELGFPTVGYDIDERRCASLRDGVSYVEDVGDDILRNALDHDYTPTADLGDVVGFDVTVITVPTPLRDGVPDLSYVASAGENLARSPERIDREHMPDYVVQRVGSLLNTHLMAVNGTKILLLALTYEAGHLRLARVAVAGRRGTAGGSGGRAVVVRSPPSRAGRDRPRRTPGRLRRSSVAGNRPRGRSRRSPGLRSRADRVGGRPRLRLEGPDAGNGLHRRVAPRVP